MKFLDKLKPWLIQMMRGRYGPDALGRALSVISLLFAFISLFIHHWIFPVLFLVFVSLFYFRVLSKDISKRYAENTLYLKYLNRLKATKTHKYFKCPNCHQTLRVPRGRGKILVTCPKCKQEMHKKS